MLALALTALLAVGSGHPSPALDPDPLVGSDPPTPSGDPCGGREGWVGDGEDGRDPPPCEERDARGDEDPAGLHEPDWLRSVDDGDDGG